MRKQLLIILALSLCACAGKPSVILQAQWEPEQSGVFGTLASSNNASEMSASALYTRLELLRYRVANAFKKGEIGIDQAGGYLAQADDIKKAVDYARNDRRILTIASQLIRLNGLISQLGQRAGAQLESSS